MEPGVDYIGVGVGALIFNERGQILLMKRGPKSRNLIGYWNVPGGVLEFGEDPLDAVKREVKEEIDVEINITDELGASSFSLRADQQHWVSFAYACKITKGSLKIMEPEKIDDLQWFDLDKIPTPHSPSLPMKIKRYLKKNKS